MVELISVHIPKTAGTAFRQVLCEVYGCDRVLNDYPPDRIYDPATVIEPKIAVIHGHFLPGKYRNLFPHAKRIVWLRNPIFRLISEYFFALNIRDYNNVFHAQLLERNLSILEYARIPAMRNFLTRHLAGAQLQEFDFVGIQEFYDRDLVSLQKLMGWCEFVPTIKNRNRDRPYQQCLQEIMNDDILIDRLARLNAADFKLYESALDIRAKRRRESLSIQYMLADWQQLKFLWRSTQSELAQKTQALQQANYWLNKNSVPNRTLELITPKDSQIPKILIGFSLDSPQFPLAIASPMVSLQGWVMGKNSPATKVRIKCDNFFIEETPVNLSRPDVAEAYHLPSGENKGFQLDFSTFGIPPQTVLNLEVALQDGSQITIAIIKVVSKARK